jgi:hypothetical protein
VCSRSSLHPRGTHHRTPHEAVSHNLTGRFLAVPRATSCFGPPTARDTPDCTPHSTLAHAHRHTQHRFPGQAILQSLTPKFSTEVSTSTCLHTVCEAPCYFRCCSAALSWGAAAASSAYMHLACAPHASHESTHAHVRSPSWIRSPYLLLPGFDNYQEHGGHARTRTHTSRVPQIKQNSPHHLPSSTTRCQVQHRFWSGANVRQE